MIIKKHAIKIRPLIKWTGGKYAEFAEFSKYIPPFNQYIEPFFGGGGVFFALQPNKTCFINDKSLDLISFYQNLNNEDFKFQSFTYADAWEQASLLAKDLLGIENNLFSEFLTTQINLKQVENRLALLFEKINCQSYYPLFDSKFNLNPSAFTKSLTHSLADKFHRISVISKREGCVFSKFELENHFETGLKSGIYLYLRKLMNDHYCNKVILPKSKAIANWYFVREFCYASMFRYNSKGEFNIPYGGMAYNHKNFRIKIERLFYTNVQLLFAKSSIYNLDFDSFLNTLKITSEDFIFLDPPYDSEFSEYDQNSFTRQDQCRLAAHLEKTPAKWMMVIKETPFIRSLYTKPGIFLLNFKKNYTYNVRGRNVRNCQHLIILNYDPICDSNSEQPSIK